MRKENNLCIAEIDEIERTPAQCGNFMIFLSLSFYVKFGDFRSAKTAILIHFQALNFDIYEFLHFLKAQVYQIHKIQNLRNWKILQFLSS